jgi:hypothetical protein
MASSERLAFNHFTDGKLLVKSVWTTKFLGNSHLIIPLLMHLAHGCLLLDMEGVWMSHVASLRVQVCPEARAVQEHMHMRFTKC